MCGILAIYLRNPQNELDKIVDGYNMLKNRGPDNGNIVVNNDVIFGFRRLAIMDITTDGNQPFKYNDDMLICNGEIFNHVDVKNNNKIECKSKSDCECLLPCYSKVGFENMIKQLNGDFAIILYSQSENAIFFARDRIGVRPLFYGFTNNGNFALASYARALTEYCVNVQAVPPGWGCYDMIDNSLEMFTYEYIPRQILNQNSISHKDALFKIKDTLEQSVVSRLMSDRPIGCLLSGGLDSSLIASILCKMINPSKVRTYSVGMEGSEDLKHARIIAEYLGTTHTEVIFTPEEGFKIIPDVIKDLETYDITTIRASVAMWLLCKYIKENTDDIVLYSGEGADELFCGYLYFHYAPTVECLGDESVRLIKNLYMYDVLRADRCVSSHGLELRVPFLDKNLIDLSMSMPEEFLEPKNGVEKHILRSSFIDGFLPEQVLWRRKDGLSDGCSGNTGKKWYEQIQEFVDSKISDTEFSMDNNNNKFPSKEAYYYKRIFNRFFSNYELKVDYWLPKWVDHDGDPSGRNLKVFTKV